MVRQLMQLIVNSQRLLSTASTSATCPGLETEIQLLDQLDQLQLLDQLQAMLHDGCRSIAIFRSYGARRFRHGCSLAYMPPELPLGAWPLRSSTACLGHAAGPHLEWTAFAFGTGSRAACRSADGTAPLCSRAAVLAALLRSRTAL